MAQPIEESLVQAIKKDDAAAFGELMKTAQCATLRLGRFPVLSLMYLYKSKRLLAIYEEKFIKVTPLSVLSEPAEVSGKFKEVAGKCLRLYLNEAVSPLEMLLILDQTKRLTRIYPLTKPSAAVKERLQNIYAIKYALSVNFKGDDIIIDRRPLSRREKKNILVATLSSALVVALAVSIPLTVDALIPKPVEGEVTKLSEIDFNSEKEYTLKNDIVLPDNYKVDKINCTIFGGGYTLTLGKGATLGTLNGKVSDVIIKTSGDTVFTTVSEIAVLENVTVNVNTDMTSEESYAFVALSNLGTIDGVTLNVSGSLYATAAADNTNSLYFGGMVLSNDYQYNASNGAEFVGRIENCTVNYTDFTLSGEASADGAFGGIAANNGSEIVNCTVTGKISSDTLDLAGVTVLNSGLLSGNVNEAELYQRTSSASWNPIVCGVVLNNTYLVQNCANRGNITSISDCGDSDAETSPAVYAAGICAMSYSSITGCINSGDVSATGAGIAFVGGILSSSEITSDYFYSVFYFGSVISCISEGKITVSGVETAYAGGIVGCIKEFGVTGNGGTTYYGGRVTDSIFIGACQCADYFGNIVGACGINIYEVNNMGSEESEFLNFDGNLYLNNNGYTAFGTVVALVEGENDYRVAEDKGATASDINDIKNSYLYKDIVNGMD